MLLYFDILDLCQAELAQLTLLVHAGFVLLVMSTIPPGAFAVSKIRQTYERKTMTSTCEEDKYAPMKYNSKLMNSIWGLYNRYSVHNFKKNTDADLQTKQSNTLASQQMFV